MRSIASVIIFEILNIYVDDANLSNDIITKMFKIENHWKLILKILFDSANDHQGQAMAVGRPRWPLINC